ncbi:hypothetical protein CDD81_2450 [Ophiocordyceps australis]|uniref:Uncharacterized protein n=1 Tax=Ophiocordyceps australis TaxID=1399860 RepID=A0A2C5XWT4_9HYPO|nr:hypothetical protein CDD81_2450 [Ophiocordyceps australis]
MEPPPGFDPVQQNITFLGPDGITPIAVPMAKLDAYTDESARSCFVYGVETGACLITLVAILSLTTPVSKLSRTAGVLQIAALILAMAHCGMLFSQYVSSVGHIYPMFGHDQQAAMGNKTAFIARSVVFNCIWAVLVLVVEAALVNQAWTMVALWHGAVRVVLVMVSLAVGLVAVALSLAFCVVQIRDNINVVPVLDDAWAPYGALVGNCLSIFWFCALFNVKLVLHLIAHRGILPSAQTLSAIDILVMTNGALMLIPVIFASLEWSGAANFDAASATHVSVAIILPLGTLAAQRLTWRFNSASANGTMGFTPNLDSSSRRSAAALTTSPTASKARSASKATTFGSTSTAATLVDREPARSKTLDHFDLELQRIDSADGSEACGCSHEQTEQLSPGTKQLLDDGV